MKARVVALIAVLGVICGQAVAGDYTLTIEGKQYEVDIGKQSTITLPDGHTFRVTLDKKATLSFESENLSFKHPGRLSPARSDLGDGIFQTMMMSPMGTLVMIQEYTTMNPCGLIDMMLNELTKEEAEYGYEITRGRSSKKLSSGIELQGKTAVSKYKGDEYTRYVLCHEARDAGLMIVTQIEKAAPEEDLDMIEMFWKSLRVSMK